MKRPLSPTQIFEQNDPDDAGLIHPQPNARPKRERTASPPKTYLIINERYSPQPTEATFEQLVEMCEKNDWDANLKLWGHQILNLRGEVVAEEKSTQPNSQEAIDRMYNRALALFRQEASISGFATELATDRLRASLGNQYMAATWETIDTVVREARYALQLNPDAKNRIIIGEK